MQYQRMKSKPAIWGDGPWMDEHDALAWCHHDVPCLLLRNLMLGQWCGYAGVTRQHPWFELHYDELDVNVHGGLTFAGRIKAALPRTHSDPSLWWLGFDCSHAGDYTPGLCGLIRAFGGESAGGLIYRDQDWAKHETDLLAEQIRAHEGKRIRRLPRLPRLPLQNAPGGVS